MFLFAIATLALQLYALLRKSSFIGQALPWQPGGLGLSCGGGSGVLCDSCHVFHCSLPHCVCLYHRRESPTSLLGKVNNLNTVRITGFGQTEFNFIRRDNEGTNVSIYSPQSSPIALRYLMSVGLRATQAHSTRLCLDYVSLDSTLEISLGRKKKSVNFLIGQMKQMQFGTFKIRELQF